MHEDILREALHEVFSSLEALETQNAAILSFLKEKGIATEEALAPHFEQAANASNVRWRAAQVRIDYLLSSATKAAEQAAEKQSAEKEKKQSAKPEAPPDSKPNTSKKSSRGDAPENSTQSAPESTTNEKAQNTEQPSEDESSSADKEKENAA
jgi:hypothetical protein